MRIENPIETTPSDGKRLYEDLSHFDLKSLRLRKENLEHLQKISSLIIIGSSWSGKTTTRNMLHDNQHQKFGL